MRFSPLVDRVAGKGAGAWRIHWEALQRKASGREVILLTVGDPDQPPPAVLIDATVESLKRGHTGYSPIVGYPEVRAAVAARHAARTGQPCTADNVVVVPGAQAGLYCALQCLAGAGDEVVAPEPMYATYEAVVGATGARLVNVPLQADRGFHLDLDTLAAAITPRTRVLWINTPHNPTGAVMTRGEVEAVAELARRHDLWVLSDEVYAELAFDGGHTSPWSLPGMAERTVVVSSLSKSHAAPGLRFGWMVGPPELSGHMYNLLLCMLYGGPPFVQDGALAALKADPPEVAAMRADYRRRAALLSGILGDAQHCRTAMPEGGMFVLLDIRGTGLTSTAFAERLLEAEDVAVLPADGFGPSAIGHLRISLTAPDAVLEEAGRRIVRFAGGLAG
ncbi:pyridoxal phosphate-dependent aminotransferase [Azospirillum sp.]|uniref:pyridoxal phosphate-dependent aminotransferase n=1 Tax=Azospirillum sp. TaxID=34012 RepID=UPI002D47BE70|nr:pyridoxal phosphate-dependent aminotransferase [Azospirillum sp.]HYD64951.1 pyridoxal phosphate-dependent aminotransferase [Azospirillum sp.]